MTTKPLTLDRAEPGRQVRILRLEDHPSTSRLLAMGLRPGLCVTLVRSTVKNAACYILGEFQQYGIRQDEAEVLWVEYVD